MLICILEVFSSTYWLALNIYLALLCGCSCSVVKEFANDITNSVGMNVFTRYAVDRTIQAENGFLKTLSQLRVCTCTCTCTIPQLVVSVHV